MVTSWLTERAGYLPATALWFLRQHLPHTGPSMRSTGFIALPHCVQFIVSLLVDRALLLAAGVDLDVRHAPALLFHVGVDVVGERVGDAVVRPVDDRGAVECLALDVAAARLVDRGDVVPDDLVVEDDDLHGNLLG